MKTLLEFLYPAKKVAVVAFGRLNPPTLGHEELVKTLVRVAAQNKGVPFLFVSHSQDSKKNPLTYEQKIKYIEMGIPDGSKVIVKTKDVKNPLDAIVYLGKKDYDSIIFVAGGDRTNEYNTLIKKYINHPDETKRLPIRQFKIHSAGIRDSDSDSVSGASASKVREAAISGDFESFLKMVPSKLSQKYAKEMYDDIRKVFHITENSLPVRKTFFMFDSPHVDHLQRFLRKNTPLLKQKYGTEYKKYLYSFANKFFNEK